ncbi:MAG: glycine zipper 2TM domain-containing protein [Rhodospirillaceae bacterium]|nr:glycine zipper 2TM domain-containing protein [Rhodospirillaceae bacterium]
MKHYLKRFAIYGALLVSLGACAETQQNPKGAVGAVLGGIGGGLLGSKVGGGKGQLAATAIGTLAGALLGHQIGKSMDDVDRLKSKKATQQALETAPSGATTSWQNPDTGNTGQITPTRTFANQQGQNCREFQHIVTIGGNTETVIGTACREPDGTWRVMG